MITCQEMKNLVVWFKGKNLGRLEDVRTYVLLHSFQNAVDVPAEERLSCIKATVEAYLDDSNQDEIWDGYREQKSKEMKMIRVNAEVIAKTIAHDSTALRSAVEQEGGWVLVVRHEGTLLYLCLTHEENDMLWDLITNEMLVDIFSTTI